MRSDRAKGSVLLLDDFPDSAEALCEWFKLEGWHADCVSTVEDALRRIDESPPAVLVMEPWLRSGSAMAVATSARAAGLRTTLLISITASSRAGGDMAYEPTLFDFNFVKPVDLETLRGALEGAPTPRAGDGDQR